MLKAINVSNQNIIAKKGTNCYVTIVISHLKKEKTAVTLRQRPFHKNQPNNETI